MAFSVRLDGVQKRFGRGARSVEAVRDLTLEIGEREFFTFVGPSGCGKTTTLAGGPPGRPPPPQRANVAYGPSRAARRCNRSLDAFLHFRGGREPLRLRGGQF
jgi:hypothetical protein